MQEKLISPKTAKRVKEKGFDEPCKFVIDNWGNIECWEDDFDELHKNSFKNASVYYSAPTQSLLQKWLREVNNINIVIQYWTGNPKPHKPVLHYKTTVNENFFGEHYITYEDALEAGLFEALNLIENKK